MATWSPVVHGRSQAGRNAKVALGLCGLAVCVSGLGASLEGPEAVPRYDVAEFTVRAEPAAGNPFTDVQVEGVFSLSDGRSIRVAGFCDSQDGQVYRLRFCPDQAAETYAYRVTLVGPNLDEAFEGRLRCLESENCGPVVVDPRHPKHFVRAGTGQAFYHLGYTAYHLLDSSNTDEQIRETIDYCARHGFNKIRFLLTGYPADQDDRAPVAARNGRPGVRGEPNYGAPPGQINPLPAWIGAPHEYDFSRFNTTYWQRVDAAVALMRERGIVATCIMTLEKQGLPDEYGTNTEDEQRLYAYAVARLAAYDNVWWDLGNEHNEYRDTAWGDSMGGFVKEQDPYDRLASAHGYAEFAYAGSTWADYIITQQYGTEREVYDWALRYWTVPKPYVNEEYGYEGEDGQPGHGQNADWVRRCHWAIALAGGYATYGDWHDTAFYTGEPSEGVAARQLVHLRRLFEELPFTEMAPAAEVTSEGFCLAKPGDTYLVYFPRGGRTALRLPEADFRADWVDPRTGDRRPAELEMGTAAVAPDEQDWALVLRTN